MQSAMGAAVTEKEHQKQRKRKRDSGGAEDDDMAKAILASLAQLDKDDKEEDRYDLFGRQVAQMLRDMDMLPKKIIKLQANITMLIADAQEE